MSGEGWQDIASERRAVSRYLTVRAARALLHREELPFWNILGRMKAQWSAVSMAIAAREIESGGHLTEQAGLVVDIGHESDTDRDAA